MELCKGGCGNKPIYKGWCGIRWKRGNKVSVICPEIEKKRAKAISEYRIKEAKLGLNPMQDPEICRENHSKERNRKAAASLKRLGELGLLPQQTEPLNLKEKRRKNVSKSLKKLVEKGIFPTQIESEEKKKERFRKVASTLKKLAAEGKLPLLNATPEKKRLWTKKGIATLRKHLKQGLVKLHNPYGKRYFYNSPIAGSLYLRSGWEIEIARLLDNLGLKWQYEPITIEYWDSTRKRKAITIPDFYIPIHNLIIEVKGSDFDLQKTFDKLEGIKNAGYKAVILGRKQMKQIRDGSLHLKDIISGVVNA